MKTILLIMVHVTDFDQMICQVTEDHPAWELCLSWQGEGNAWVDQENDPLKWAGLIDEFSKLPQLDFPCHIDGVIFYPVY